MFLHLLYYHLIGLTHTEHVNKTFVLAGSGGFILPFLLAWLSARPQPLFRSAVLALQEYWK